MMKMNNKYILIFLTLLLAVGVWLGIREYRRAQLNKMVGQMILVGFRGTSPDDESVRELANDIRAGRIGGVILFSFDVASGVADGIPRNEIRWQTKSRNIIDIDQVRELNDYLQNAASARPPLFVSIDFEGGRISRILPEHRFDFVLDSAKELAANYPPETVGEMYYELGIRLRDLGFNVNFAPTVDVDINPHSPAIGAMGRAFSDDAALVTKYGRAASDGLARANIIYSLKHFPGHGSADVDSHHGTVDITNTWVESELIPYRELARTDMPGMVMVAHVFKKTLDAEFPASLSPKIVDGMLRTDIGFDGVVITDDLQMGAIYEHYGLRETLRLAILAGNDIMLLGNCMTYTENLGRIAYGEIIDMVRRGEIPRSRIKESYRRIIKLKGDIK